MQRMKLPPWQIGDNGNAIRCHIDIERIKNSAKLMYETIYLFQV